MAGKVPAQKLNFDQLGGITGVPPEFIAAMDLHEEVTPGVANNVAPQALSDTVFFSRVETPRDNERELHTYFKKPGNIVLSGFNTDSDGQPVQVVRTLFRTGAGTPTVFPSATTKVAITDLGNTWSVQEASVDGTYVDGVFTPSVFAAKKYEYQIPDVVPERFRAITPVKTLDQTVEGTAQLPVPVAGDLDLSEEQVDQYKKRVHRMYRDVTSLPATLYGEDTDEQKRLVTVRETLQLDSAPTALQSATKSVQIQALGAGLVLQIERYVSAVFAAAQYTAENVDPLPRKFGGILPITSTVTTQEGTAGPVTLGTGELRRSATQLDVFLYRLEIAGRSSSSLPVSLISYSTNDQRQKVTITETLQLSTASVPDPTALLTVNAENLGNGTTFVTTQSVAGYAIEYGQESDRNTGLAIPFSERTVPTSQYDTYAGLSDTTITPIDELRLRVRQMTNSGTDFNTFMRAAPKRAQVRLPDRLLSFIYNLSSGVGSGGNTETGTGDAAGTSGNVTLSASNTAEFNVAGQPEVTPIFAARPESIQPVLEYFFFVETNPTATQVLDALNVFVNPTGTPSTNSVQKWPKFNEQEHVISMFGGSCAVQLSAQARISYAFGETTSSYGKSEGGGASTKYERSVRNLVTRPAIHGPLTIVPSLGLSFASTPTGYSVSASLSLGSITATGNSGTFGASIDTNVVPSSLAATSGVTAFPSTGLYLYDYQVDTVEVVPGLVPVRAIVFDFAEVA